MARTRTILLATMAALLLAQQGDGQPARQAPDLAPGVARAPVVVELFTSQACSSCPPAEALLRDYAKRADLIALEWHVDYWNTQKIDGRSWRDPFSRPEWTERQSVYAKRLGGGVYTPETVVDGRAQAAGFDRAAIDKLIAAASARRAMLSISARRDDKIRFRLTPLPANGEPWLVTYRLDADTQVTGGENHGRRLVSSHLVTGLTRLPLSAEIAVPLPAAGEGCALLVQGGKAGPVVAAAPCP